MYNFHLFNKNSINLTFYAISNSPINVSFVGIVPGGIKGL